MSTAGIILILITHVYDGDVVSFQRFGNMSACEAAIGTILQARSPELPLKGFSANCVPEN